jgi:hypothetical protein
MVATPAVPVKGEAVQQWMCDAVVVPSKPWNVTLMTDNVFATSSVITVAEPVPGDAFGGDSPGPVRLTEYVIIVAWLAEIESMSAPITATTGERYRTTVSFDFM